MINYLIILIIIAYLIGSFSTAYWFGKWFHNLDIRKLGSKNAGATNAIRVLGLKTGIVVFIIDILKSFSIIHLVHVIPDLANESETFYIIKIALGASAVIGHIFPLYSNFDGGKGVASMLGVILALHPIGALITLGVFTIMFLSTKIVSLSSLTASLFFPGIIYLMEGTAKQSLLIFGILASLMIVVTHTKNIKRLLKGEEKRMSFKN
jgi:acyl phosphate:glycerol-3-phosphate acyltransferase